MTYEVGRLGPQQLRSVYCSNTAGAAMISGRCVAIRGGGSVVADDGDGTGFGFAVDYPSATNSIVLGVLYHPEGSTSRAGSPGLCVRQGVVPVAHFATTTAYDLLVGRATAAAGFCSSIGATAAIFHHGIFGQAMSTVTGTTTVTGTAFVTAVV